MIVFRTITSVIPKGFYLESHSINSLQSKQLSIYSFDKQFEQSLTMF